MTSAASRRPPLLRHLTGAILLGLLSTAGLALWNVIEVALAARLYRNDPGRLVDLAGLCVAWYLPLTTAPLLLFSIVRWLLPWSGEPAAFDANRLREDSPALRHAGAAVAVALLLFSIGILAQRDPPGSWSARPLLADLLVAAGGALSAGIAAQGILRERWREGSLSPRARAGAVALTALPLSLLAWQAARDHLGGRGGAAALVALGGGALAAGSIGAFLVMRAAVAAAALARRIDRRHLLGALLLLLAGGTAARLATAASSPALAAPGRPNVVLIVADTLRADHVGCYGAARTRTPSIDRLAASGVRFAQVYAASAWTAPATASLLTALYPGNHGLLTYHDQIREGAVSMASVFREAGYRTAGFSANPILSARYGFGAGFDTWEEEIDPDRLQRHRPSPLYATLALLGLRHPADLFPDGEHLVSRALSWLDAGPGGPFFLYVHFMDAHDPYAPPAPYRTMYGDPSRSAFGMRIGTLAAIMDGKERISRDDLERMRDLYDGSVSYIDSQVGRLVGELGRLGLGRETLVAFTADHGEEFLDHGDLEHTRTLFDEITRIPFAIAGPGIEGGRVIEGPVRQIDVAPTLLGAAGLAFPGRVEGISQWPFASGREAEPAPRDAYMELSYPGFRSPWHTVVALRRGPFKMIGASFDPGRGGPWTWTLFDLRGDPGERSDASGAHGMEAAAMRGSLEAWSRRPLPARSAGGKYDEETERRLRALGYID